MLKEIRAKDGRSDKIQGTLHVSELVSFLFSLPYMSTMLCQWPIYKIRICEPTLFHATGLPLDDQPGSSRAAPQTPNPALRGACVISMLVQAEYMYILCILYTSISISTMHYWTSNAVLTYYVVLPRFGSV